MPIPIRPDVEPGGRYRQITGRERKGEALMVLRVTYGGVVIRYERDGQTQEVSGAFWTPKRFKKNAKENAVDSSSRID